MRLRSVAPLLGLGALLAASAPAPKETAMNTQPKSSPHQRTHAEAHTTVHSREVKPYDQSAAPTLAELNLTEIFAGDIDGESTSRALVIQHADRSSNMVSVQRVRGKLGGRAGTFVLQGSETVENGKMRATWFVVPGSGTDGLSGLRGEGGFEGGFGNGSKATLDYWFE